MGIVSRLRRRETLDIPIVYESEYESPVQTEARLAVILCRNYQEDKRTRRGRGCRGEGGVARRGEIGRRIRRESVMAEGSGAYKWARVGSGLSRE